RRHAVPWRPRAGGRPRPLPPTRAPLLSGRRHAAPCPVRGEALAFLPGVDRTRGRDPEASMYGPQGNGAPKRPSRKITVPEIRARKGGAPLAMITAYDFTMARLLDEGGADILLVGDSLGMVVQGHATTLPVTVEEICYHGRAVMRGARRAHVVGDMPFMSFQVSAVSALKNAGKLMKEGSFESVKLEGG